MASEKGKEQLQRSVFKWVQAADDEAHGHAALEKGKVKKTNAMITAQEVARKYGVPEDKLRNYIRHEIEEEASCRALPFTLLMFMSYVGVVLWHDPVVPINDVEDSIAFDIEENANFAFTDINIKIMGHKAIYDINSYADFWSWMIQGFVPLMYAQERGFAEGRDMDDPEVIAVSKTLARHERGYLLQYNKIVGGIRIRQERGKTQTCGSLDILLPFYNQACVGNLEGSGYELAPELATAKHTIDPQREFWIWANEDAQDVLDTMIQKEKDGWLDRETKKIEISIPVYNGNLGVYSIVYVNFFFSRGGHIWKRILPLSTYSQWWHGWHNLVPDILWMFGLLSIFMTEIVNVCTTLTAKTGGGLKGIYYEYLSFWNIVDWTTVVGGFWIIVGLIWRFARTSTINYELKNLSMFDEVKEQEAFRRQSMVFLDVLQSEVATANNFRIILGSYPLLIVMRLFEAFAHQPRLSIVTSTLGDAAVDLVHFLLVFISIFITYAVAGVVLFGREVDTFTNLMRSHITCFRIMMGDFDWEEMRLVGRIEAGFWFGSYIVIIAILMLNMLLAIVMDAYSEQKQAMGDAETLWEELLQAVHRWKGERSGELRSLKEVSRAVRTIKDGESQIRVTGGGNPKMGFGGGETNNPVNVLAAKSGFLAAKTHSAIFRDRQQEEYCLVTVDSLIDACPKMQEDQAMDVLTSAAMDYYMQSRGDTNIEEMCHIIRKVNFSTKRLKRHMKASLIEMEREKELEMEKQKTEVALRIKEGRMAMGAAFTVPADGPTSKNERFAEMLGECRNSLRNAAHWIGNEEMRDVDMSQARDDTPMELVPLNDMEDAVEFSVKRIVDDEGAVLKACRLAGIGQENDYQRTRAVGKVVRIMQKDVTDRTVKCRIPRVGDIWFAIGALCQLRPKAIDLAEELAKKSEEDKAGASDSGYGDSEFGKEQEEIVRRINDLVTEKMIGQQTVTEAINAVSELKWQQVKEKTDRSKLHQKILGLKKKLVSRAREHRKLAQEASRQEERLTILTQSRDEYRDLVSSLLEEKRKLQERLGHAPTRDVTDLQRAMGKEPLAIEDQPTNGHANGHHGDRARQEAGRERDLARSRERELALEAMRSDREPMRDRDESRDRRDRREQRNGHGRMALENGHRGASENGSERGRDRRKERRRDRDRGDSRGGERDDRHARRR